MDNASEAFRGILASELITEELFEGVGEKIELFGASEELTEWACTILRGGNAQNRRVREIMISSVSFPWSVVWSGKISPIFARRMVASLRSEVNWIRNSDTDYDLAYLCDVVRRITAGLAMEDPELIEAANQELKRAADLYSKVLEGPLNLDGPPNVDGVLKQIKDRVDEHVASRPDSALSAAQRNRFREIQTARTAPRPGNISS